MNAETNTSKRISGLYGFSLLLVVSTFVLLIAGGLVTSHEAGLAVPDWPLSYGQWMPPMVGNVAWEHGHRMIAGTVGLLTLVLAIFVQMYEKRRWLQQLTWIAFAAVVLQALLGGLTVIYMLPAPISIFHACLGQSFFCLLIAIAYFLSPTYKEGRVSLHTEITGRTKRLFLITTIMIYLQLILGAAIRHTNFSTIPHIFIAVLVLIHVGLVVRHAMNFYASKSLITKPALFLGFMTLLQIFLGMAAFVYTRMMDRGYAPSKEEVFITAAHQSIGALILAASFFLTLVIWTATKDQKQ